MVDHGLASHPFDVAAAVFGGLLICGALISVLAHRTFVSLAAVFVVAGARTRRCCDRARDP